MASSVTAYILTLLVRFWESLRHQETLPAEQVPLIVHGPGILTGYRLPSKPWSYYVISLFQIHNETLNIWTHLIGSLVVLQQVYAYLQIYDFTTDKLAITIIAAGYAFFLSTFMSTIVHLLHSKSTYIHLSMFTADYLTAAFCIYGTGILSMYGYSDPEFYAMVGNWYLIMQACSLYFVFVFVVLGKFQYGHNPHDARRLYVLIAAYGFHLALNCVPVLPRYLKCYRDPECSMFSLMHLTNVIVITFAQGLAYGSHQPELTWPGKFDIVGSSHQWFHVLTTVSHVAQFRGLFFDFTNGNTTHCQPDAFLVFGVTGAVTLVGISTLAYFIKLVPEKFNYDNQ